LSIEGYPGRDHVTVGELAEQLQIAPHSAVGLVDRLEKSGLVKREAAPDDGRKVWVSLRQTGIDLLEKLFLTHRGELRSIVPRLSALLRDAAERMPVEMEAL
jgi:DNA-binding MarR family transcriptional regulator